MLCPILCPRCVNTIVTCYFCWVCLCLFLGTQLYNGFAAVPWVGSCVLGTVLCPKSCAVPIVFPQNSALCPLPSIHYSNFCYLLFVHSFSMSCCLHALSCMCSQLCSMWTAPVPYAYSKLCPLSNVVNYICPLLCPEYRDLV